MTPAEFTIEDDDELQVRAFSEQVAVAAGEDAEFTVELTGETTEDVEVDYSISLLTTMLAGLGVPDTPLSVNPRTAALPDGGTLMLPAGESTGTITVETDEMNSGDTIQVRLDEVRVGEQPMAPVNVAGTPSRTRVVDTGTLLADLGVVVPRWQKATTRRSE